MLFPQLVSGWGWNCREVSADRASQRLMLAGKKIWNVSKSEESGRSLWWSVISLLARRCEISFSGWAHFMFCIRKQLLLVRLSISANLMSYPYKWAALVVGNNIFQVPQACFRPPDKASSMLDFHKQKDLPKYASYSWHVVFSTCQGNMDYFYTNRQIKMVP